LKKTDFKILQIMNTDEKLYIHNFLLYNIFFLFLKIIIK